MGIVQTEITLKNISDLVIAQKGYIKESDIRFCKVTALVDTGAMTLVINEEIRQKLGLNVVETQTAILADDSEVSCDVTELVQICWKNRTSATSAWVFPENNEILLGVVPLEEMDLMVDPVHKVLVGAHGDKIRHRI